MAHQFANLIFTDSVMRAQAEFGSRGKQARFAQLAGPNDELGQAEAEFIAARDSFYMATVNQEGWPYVQHRGGPPGFLRALGPKRLAYADFRGNTQLVSMGNSLSNDRVSLILVDYPNRRRLKLLGHLKYHDVRHLQDAAEVGEEHSAIPVDLATELAAVALPGYRARIERLATIDVVAFDWNCPQHITRRYTLEELKAPA